MASKGNQRRCEHPDIRESTYAWLFAKCVESKFEWSIQVFRSPLEAGKGLIEERAIVASVLRFRSDALSCAGLISEQLLAKGLVKANGTNPGSHK